MGHGEYRNQDEKDVEELILWILDVGFFVK